MKVGSDQGTDRQTMSVIELSWTAKNAYFSPIWTILLKKFSVIFHKWGGGGSQIPQRFGNDGIYATDEFIEVMEAKGERDIPSLLKTSFL